MRFEGGDVGAVLGGKGGEEGGRGGRDERGGDDGVYVPGNRCGGGSSLDGDSQAREERLWNEACDESKGLGGELGWGEGRRIGGGGDGGGGVAARVGRVTGCGGGGLPLVEIGVGEGAGCEEG